VPEVVLGIIIVIVVNGDGGDVATLVTVVVVVDGGDGDGNMNYRRCTSLWMWHFMAVKKKKKMHHSFYRVYPNNMNNRCSGYSALEVESKYCWKLKSRDGKVIGPLIRKLPKLTCIAIFGHFLL
jgi:hypothetical protein